MTGRLVSVGIALVGLVAVVGAIVAACYDVPRPACGFVCGPDGACPDGYACASDGYCHAGGSPESLDCRRPDGALPDDAAIDGPPDGRDGQIDAPVDGPADAADDVAVDG